MALVTLADLRLRTRQSADMVYSQFVTDAEVLTYINSAYSDYYGLVVKAYEDHYLQDPVSFTIASGNVYALPATFFKLVGLDFLDGGQWVEVKSFEWNQRNVNSTFARDGRYHPRLRYRITGNELRFIPTDQATGTYQYWAIPLFTPLAADNDTVNGYNGWEEYIVLKAAIKCLRKEESSIRDHQAAVDKLESDILEIAKVRDVGETHGTTDVYANDYGYGGNYGGY